MSRYSVLSGMLKMPCHIGVAIIASICVAASAGSAHGAEPKHHSSVHWGYEGIEGPEHWGDLSPAFALCCMGTEQSPINIVQPDAANIDNIAFDYYPSAVNIFNPRRADGRELIWVLNHGATNSVSPTSFRLGRTYWLEDGKALSREVWHRPGDAGKHL